MQGTRFFMAMSICTFMICSIGTFIGGLSASATFMDQVFLAGILLLLLGAILYVFLSGFLHLFIKGFIAINELKTKKPFNTEPAYRPISEKSAIEEWKRRLVQRIMLFLLSAGSGMICFSILLTL